MLIDKPADESPATAEACANCRFSAIEGARTAHDGSVIQGRSITCRRFPDYQQHHANDWCGEYKDVLASESAVSRELARLRRDQ